MFVCLDETANSICNNVPNRLLNVTTKMSIFSRRASTVSARRSSSTITVSDISTAIPYPLDDIQALHAAMEWLLNYTAVGLPPRSSMASLFWNSVGTTEHDWSVSAHKTLTSLLAITTWLSTENNYGNLNFDPTKLTDRGLPFVSTEFTPLLQR